MDVNPYAPPKAAVADVAPPVLKRRSVLLMIVIFVLTLGFYYPIWFLRRRAALNRLDSPKKLHVWPFAIYGAVLLVGFLVGMISGATGEEPLGSGTGGLLRLVDIAVGILMIVQGFIVKDILEDHLAGPHDEVPSSLFVEQVKLSGLMTFFFQIFYLQWAINRYIVGSQATVV